MSEQVAVLGEIRDQLKRIADYLEHGGLFNVELGEPIVTVRKLPEK